MDRVNGRLGWALAAVTAALAALVTLVAPAPVAQPAEAAASPTRPLVLPIPPGETWYVCQGYNGGVTHSETLALDLSVAPRSVGPQGCMARTRYSSAGATVSSPTSGTAYRWPGCCGDDFVCVTFDSGGSAAIGHLYKRVPSGARVQTGDRIGAVAWPRPSNGDYAHIHVQVHPTPNCTEGSDPVPFDEAYGFKWACTPNLPYLGNVNEHSGLAVTRCDSIAGPPRAPRARDEQDVASEAAKWARTTITQVLHLVGSPLAD